MRKVLLSAAMLAGVLANAQSTSFEASEGYVVGESVLNNPDGGWVTYTANGLVTTNLAKISSGLSTDGTQALTISANGQLGTSANPLPYPRALVEVEDTPTQSYSFDINVSSVIIATADDYSDAIVRVNGLVPLTVNGETAEYIVPTAGVNFSYLDYLSLYQPDASSQSGVGIPGFQNLTFERDTWYNFTIEINNNAITYFLNGQAVHTTTVGPLVTTRAYYFEVLNDNYGSAFTIDNIQISAELDAPTFNSDSFRIYPNPVQDKITITLAHAQVLEGVKIYDMNGRMVKSFQATDLTNTFDIADLAAGVYTVEVSSAKGSATKKLVKN